MQSGEEHSVLRYALTGDLQGLVEYLETVESSSLSDSESTNYLFKEKDELGRNAFFTACALGTAAMIRELLKHGAEINAVTARGYSALHYSALWGHLDTVKLLVSQGADMHQKTFRGERAVDVASRYSNTECTEYLNWAEAKEDFLRYISHVRDAISDPEKVQGKLTKDEKSMCSSVCAAEWEWLQRDPPTQDLIQHRKQLDDSLSAVLCKITLLSDITAKAVKA